MADLEISWRQRAGKVVRMSSSVHPTLIGGSLIDFLSLLRWFFLYEPYNFILEFDFISMKILHVCMFLIGVSITVECLFSIVSYISQLQFLTVLKEYRIIFQMWPFFILMLTASSVANAVSLFFQVRDLWVQHMFVTIQILHCVPSLLLVTHSLMQGIYLHLLSEVDSEPLQGDTKALTKHLQSQIRLNFTFMFYSLTTGLAIAYNSQSVEAYASVGYMLGEIVYRLRSIHLLGSIHVVEEEDDRFPSGISETGYNTQTDGFCPSGGRWLPLLNTFCRWVCGFRRSIFNEN